jgi:lysophospholipase L1-like esterase
VVVALPSGLASGEFPGYLVEMGFTRSAAEAIADHRAYAAAARDAAVKAGVGFVDLQPFFEGPDGVTPGLFRADKIHTTDAGNARIAEVLDPEMPLAPGRR